jgi:hypothetical protein
MPYMLPFNIRGKTSMGTGQARNTVHLKLRQRGKIRLIKSNAKCCNLKNLPVKGLCGK